MNGPIILVWSFTKNKTHSWILNILLDWKMKIDARRKCICIKTNRWIIQKIILKADIFKCSGLTDFWKAMAPPTGGVAQRSNGYLNGSLVNLTLLEVLLRSTLDLRRFLTVPALSKCSDRFLSTISVFFNILSSQPWSKAMCSTLKVSGQFKQGSSKSIGEKIFKFDVNFDSWDTSPKVKWSRCNVFFF